ncbi:MAG: hypothetical protein V7677_14845 [Motiliproteus sp.]
MFELTLGWMGTAFYILAHGWLSVLKRQPEQGYYWANFLAAVLVALSSAMLTSWQPVLINGFWALVSLAAIYHFQLPNLNVSNRRIFILVCIMFCTGVLALVLFGRTGIDILAWSSVAAFCLSYWRFVARQLSRKAYFLFGAYAAFTLLPKLYFDQNWPVFLLEVIWGGLSVIGYLRLCISLKH